MTINLIKLKHKELYSFMNYTYYYNVSQILPLLYCKPSDRSYLRQKKSEILTTI